MELCENVRLFQVFGTKDPNEGCGYLLIYEMNHRAWHVMEDKSYNLAMKSTISIW